MKRGILIIMTFASLNTVLFAQEVSLKDCWAWTKEYYPKAKDRKVLLDNSTMRIENLKTTWYPKLNLNGQATWQNQVTEISNPMIKSTPQNKDQYKATLDINQTLYDGGISSAKRKIESASSATEMLTLDVELYNMQKNVSDIFFINLMLEAQNEQINLNKENISARIKEIEGAVNAGSILKSELDVLRVELLKLQQKEYDIMEGKASSIRTLALLTGKPLNADSTKLTMFEIAPTTITDNKRIELQLFDQQKQSLELQSKLLAKNRMPQLNAFAQGGYGNPGLNMMKSSFEPIVYVGVKLTWNIWDWNQTSRQKRIAMDSRQLIDDQRLLFEQTQSMNIEKSESQIKKLERSLSFDDEIVKLRHEVTQTSKSKLANGTLRASDYINDLNQETNAVLEQKIRQIQLDQARIDLMQILGQN